MLRGPELGSQHPGGAAPTLTPAMIRYGHLWAPALTCTDTQTHTYKSEIAALATRRMVCSDAKMSSKFAIRGSNLVSPESEQRANLDQLQNNGSYTNFHRGLSILEPTV